MVFLKEFFKNVDFEKNQQMTKSMQNYPVGKVLIIIVADYKPFDIFLDFQANMAEDSLENIISYLLSSWPALLFFKIETIFSAEMLCNLKKNL